MTELVLGTRGSALALAQVDMTEGELATAWPQLATRREIFTTRGDQKLDLNLLTKGDGGGKGLFTRELEDALLAGTIDVAVHSLKDLPGHQPDGLEIAAVLERAPSADVLISKSPGGLTGLPQNSRIGTSSIRRARQLTWLRPDLQICEWRGNVPTRLRKLAEQPDIAAIVLAEAGLRRLGYTLENDRLQEKECDTGVPPVLANASPAPGNPSPVSTHPSTIPPNSGFFATSLAADLLPAIGQGAIALQIRSNRPEVRAIIAPINHASTMLAIRAERELQRLLGGDCSLPVGVRTTLHADGRLHLRAILFGPEGQPPRQAEASGENPETVARDLFARLQP